MTICKSFEQALFVILILASQKGHEPLKSSLLSRILEVSDSSLKKVLRKLVVSGLIFSEANKEGGFTIARPLCEISLNDVLAAVEDRPLVDYKVSNLAMHIFSGEEHIAKSEKKIHDAIESGEKAFSKELSKLKLDSLLEEGAALGVVDWKNR